MAGRESLNSALVGREDLIQSKNNDGAGLGYCRDAIAVARYSCLGLVLGGYSVRWIYRDPEADRRQYSGGAGQDSLCSIG